MPGHGAACRSLLAGSCGFHVCKPPTWSGQSWFSFAESHRAAGMSPHPGGKQSFTYLAGGAGAGLSALPCATVGLCTALLTLCSSWHLSMKPHGWTPGCHQDSLPPGRQHSAPPAHVHREEKGVARCLVEWGQIFFPDFFFSSPQILKYMFLLSRHFSGFFLVVVCCCWLWFFCCFVLVFN